nr:MAG: replication initiator protein [Microviridae sp.]
MPCFSPLQGWTFLKSDGKKQIVFSDPCSSSWCSVLLPCGQCVGCRLERSRQWAIRCVHEASMYDHNCFITLTFDDKSLFSRSNPMSLDVSEFQRFMKRFRKWTMSKSFFDSYGYNVNGIRFFHCGEYGDLYRRPHYHACIFNFDFRDRVLWKVKEGVSLYRSSDLERLWPYGHSSVGDVTFESAAYVARYIMKKINGKSSDLHYEFVDPSTGEWYLRKPEYTTMSRGGRGVDGKNLGGIGSQWFDKWAMIDTYPNDYVVVRNRKMRPPKFYDSKLDPIMLESVKAARVAAAMEFCEDQTYRRLVDREKCANAKLALFGRNVE